MHRESIRQFFSNQCSLLLWLKEKDFVSITRSMLIHIILNWFNVDTDGFSALISDKYTLNFNRLYHLVKRLMGCRERVVPSGYGTISSVNFLHIEIASYYLLLTLLKYTTWKSKWISLIWLNIVNDLFIAWFIRRQNFARLFAVCWKSIR